MVIAALFAAYAVGVGLPRAERREQYMPPARPLRLIADTTVSGGASRTDQQRLTLSIALAQSYRLQGQPQKSRDLLTSLGNVAWPSAMLEAEYYDELAKDDEAIGKPELAFQELGKAVAVEANADRQFRLGQLAEKLGKPDEARRYLAAAAAAEPKNLDYKLALAYALRRAGEAKEAARLISEVLKEEPTRTSLHEDLAYTYLSAGENEEAVRELKYTIDNEESTAAANPKQELAKKRKIAELQRSISSVEPHWTIDAYSNICVVGNHCNARTSTLGNFLSSNQGGISLSYQPPGIGYIDGRRLELFERNFFSYKQGTLQPQANSLQAGIGIRYKPLRDYNLIVSGERLIKVGHDAQNNWLARTAFSAGAGYVPDPGVDWSPYSLFYADLAATLLRPHEYLTYFDGRWGLNHPITDRFIVSPFAYGTIRGNFGVGRNSSIEAGVGLSLRTFFDFDGDKYHAPAGAVELLPRLGYTVVDTRAPTGIVFSLTLVARY